MELVRKLGIGGLVVGGAMLVSGAVGNVHAGNPLEDAIKGGIQRKVFDEVRENRGGNTVNNNCSGLSEMENVALNTIRNNPVVIYQGDLDGDGKGDWGYFPGNGKAYEATRAFGNNGKQYTLERESPSDKVKYFFYDERAVGHVVPENTIIIWDGKSK